VADTSTHATYFVVEKESSYDGDRATYLVVEKDASTRGLKEFGIFLVVEGPIYREWILRLVVDW
jgi:hypothetical protein